MSNVGCKRPADALAKVTQATATAVAKGERTRRSIARAPKRAAAAAGSLPCKYAPPTRFGIEMDAPTDVAPASLA